MFVLCYFWAYLPAITILCLWGKLPSHLLKVLISEMCPASEKSPAWIRMSPSGKLCVILEIWLWVSLTHTTLWTSCFEALSYLKELKIKIRFLILLINVTSCMQNLLHINLQNIKILVTLHFSPCLGWILS